MLRWHAEFFLYASLIQTGIGHGVDQRHMRIHQLRHVFIAGGNHHFLIVLNRLIGQRADNIVGFHAVDNQQRQTHGADNLVNRFNLFAQFVRHGRAMRLVFRVNIVAEGFSFGIEHHHQLRAIKVFLQFADHTDHAFHGVGVQTFGVGQQRNGMKGTEQVRRTVYKNDRPGHIGFPGG